MPKLSQAPPRACSEPPEGAGRGRPPAGWMPCHWALKEELLLCFRWPTCLHPWGGRITTTAAVWAWAEGSSILVHVEAVQAWACHVDPKLVLVVVPKPFCSSCSHGLAYVRVVWVAGGAVLPYLLPPFSY